MHHVSTELLSTSNSTLIPYLNTDSPFIHGFPSFTLQSSFNNLHHTAIEQHVQSRWTSILFLRTLLTLRWKTSPSPTVPSSWNSPYDHSSLLDRPFDASSAPSWHSLLFLSLDLQHPLWFLSLQLNNIPIAPIHSYWPTLSSTFTTPDTYHFGEDIMVWEGNTLCQGKGKGLWTWQYYMGSQNFRVIESTSLKTLHPILPMYKLTKINLGFKCAYHNCGSKVIEPQMIWGGTQNKGL